MNRFIVFTLLLFSAINISNAAKKLPIPRFVTIKFNEVNVRTGPTADCPIEWVFVKKGEPVEVVAGYGNWYKIKDIEGQGGWAHSSVLSNRRSVIIKAKKMVPLFLSPAGHEDIIAKLKPDIRCYLNKCKKDRCQINCKSYKGWVERKFLWGIYPDE